MPGGNQDWEPIRLSAKGFGHISQGLYRRPAGAIKELISNAFDADAEPVKIHTGFPPYTRHEIDRLKLTPEDELIKGGEYRLEDTVFEEAKKGVRIYTKYLRESFRKRMSDLSRFCNLKLRRSKRPYGSFADFMS